MRITKEQESILDEFQCLRVNKVHHTLLDSISCPVIDGENRSSLIDHFRNSRHINDDKAGTLASYIVTNKSGQILMYFSIRCGELFEKIDYQRMVLSHNALVGFNKLKNTPGISEEDRDIALQKIKDALDAGLSYEDFHFYAKKKHIYMGDIKKEPNTIISRVSVVYSGVELKFFGINDNARCFWRELNLPKKMGETLFWYFIVPKLERLKEIVGCQFLYLFAADREADGHLVTYYRTVLHINAEPRLSSNKPFFDYESVFLYQDINFLSAQKRKFLDTFNPDTDDQENV